MFKCTAAFSLSTTFPVVLISSSKHNHIEPLPSTATLSLMRIKQSSASIEASSELIVYRHHRNPCRARRRVRYEAERDDGDEEEEYGHNEEIALLEMYSQAARDEALLVRALVDDKEEEILIFKGFSSSLTYGTSPDLSKSVLPARAVIKFVDRVKGPFNPANIEYIEQGVSWESFRTRLFSQ